MINLLVVDAESDVFHALTGLVLDKIRHPLLPGVVLTRIVFDNNPYPVPRVYVHSDGGYDGDEVFRLAKLCESLNLPLVNDGEFHYPELAKDPTVVFYGGAADGVEAAVKEGHILDELAKAHGERLVLIRPPAGTWTVNGPVQIAEFRPPISRADPKKASALDLEIVRLLRMWGYDGEAYKIESGVPGMTFIPKFEH